MSSGYLMIQGLLFCCILVFVHGGALTKDILKDYERKVRPAQSINDSVRVVFKIYLNELIDVSEVSQKIETKLWLYHRWTDTRLQWNTSDYKGREFVHLRAEELWLPIFLLYNNADGDFAVTDKRTAKVYFNGTIEWKPPMIFSSFCEIQVANFPFDTQNCTMKIGPWTRGADLLDMVNSDGQVTNHRCEAPEIDNYGQNGEWKLLKTGCYKHYINYTCCREPYVDMTYFFVIQRRPLYLLMAILFPTMLFSLLTSIVFYLPSGSAEKITLSISLLLTLVVFLLVIVDAIPSTATGVPLLGTYILFTMILVTLSIILTIFVLNIHYRTPSTHSMPFRVKKVFMVTLPARMFSSTIRKVDPHTVKKSEEEKKSYYNEISDISGREEGVEKPLMLNPDSKEAIDGVQGVSQHYRNKFRNYKEQMEWQYVAMVIDHFLLYIFIITCFSGTIFIFGKRLMDMPYEADRFQSNEDECLLNC